jgi:hypothetical protein
MDPQDYFALAVALLATVLAIASGWLRYDNANDEEETSEFWYDTGVVLGVLYMITIVVIYFAQTSHEAIQAYRESGPEGLHTYAQGRFGARGGSGSTHAVNWPPGTANDHSLHGRSHQTIGTEYGFGDSFEGRGFSTSS